MKFKRALTHVQESAIHALMDLRLKSSQHESSDHLDNALMVRKLKEIHRGPGTPEGAVTAGVGDIYLRTDGGAGTSFYVKESGTGNTGWVGK